MHNPPSVRATRRPDVPCATRDCAQPHLTIDLDALRANYRAAGQACSPAKTGAAVKANAYGLGIAPVARALCAEGCETFFVATTIEGAELRQCLAPAALPEIFILDGVQAGEWAIAFEHGLSPVINSSQQLRTWLKARAEQNSDLCAAIHVDTGMNRLGFRFDDFAQVLNAPDALRNANITMVMSHLACADTPDHPMNRKQLKHFREIVALVSATNPEIRFSLANSGGVFMGPDFGFDLTRPGIALYGGLPHLNREHVMRPVASLTAPILQFSEVHPGESVGYGAEFTASSTRRTATVALGYADGFLRSGAHGGYGFYDNVRTPILGRVSMDLIVVDMTDAPPAIEGEQIEFLGPHVLLDDVADIAGTAAYEVLTRLGPRCMRTYLGEVAWPS